MYADDTQVYISFKLKTSHEAVDTINECISDLRTWMINHKLKINDSKTVWRRTEAITMESSCYQSLLR